MTDPIHCPLHERIFVIVDRYLEAGLLRNPFAAVDPAVVRPGGFCDRGLPAPPRPGSTTLVQVIGAKGAGKTSQLHEWRRQVDGPYHYVPAVPYKSRWVRPPVGPIVYGDEVDRMPRLLRQLWFTRLARAGATVVVGTHVDLSVPAQRAGLQVITNRLAGVDLVTLRAIIDLRLRQVKVASRLCSLQLGDADLRWIHDRCGGSIREAEVHGHELVARRVAHFEPTAKGD